MRKLQWKWIGLLALAGTVQCGFFFTPNASAADHLTVSGCSISVAGYLTELAGEYERRSGVKVFVRGGGSVIGIEDLKEGRVDLAASCRPKERDDPENFEFVQVAWDALVFIVHPSNTLQNISLDEAKSIYGGRLTSWKQLGGRDAPIRIFLSRARRGLSGVEASIRQLVLNGKEPAESPNISPVPSSAIAEQMVERTPDGFAATGILSARKRNVKLLNLNGVPPTNTSIIRKSYPLKRPLFLLIPKPSSPDVRRFVDFALSKEGQRFLQSRNVISLMDVQ